MKYPKKFIHGCGKVCTISGYQNIGDCLRAFYYCRRCKTDFLLLEFEQDIEKKTGLEYRRLDTEPPKTGYVVLEGVI